MIEESLELIATRQPPGDNWALESDKNTTITGLVETLTTYLRKTGFKGEYRLAPLDGKLYAIKQEEVIEEQPVWDLYGEH